MTSPKPSSTAVSKPLKIGLFVLIALTAMACGIWLASTQQSDSLNAEDLKSLALLPEARPLPNFRLLNKQGQPVTRASLVGQWHLWFFGFSHCPHICPNTLGLLQQAYVKLPAAQQQQVQITLVSVDPERDTPERLNNYLNNFNDQFAGITGDNASLKSLREAVYIPAGRIELDDGTIDFDHGTALVLINPQAEVVGYFTSPHQPDNLSSDLQLILP